MMSAKYITFLILFHIISLFVHYESYAGIERLIKSITPSGTMSNVTRRAIINEQSAGHIIGGSIMVRTPATQALQIVNVRAPSCSMGGLPCGAAFELLEGGVSIVKGAELMAHLKSLVSNAAAYGGMMAIKTLCPQCEDLMSWLDAKADWINGIAKSDCEDMVRLADGALSKIMAGSRAVRQSSDILYGSKKDMAQYIQHSKRDDHEPVLSTPELESILGDNYNLVWKAFEKRAQGIGEDKLFKEMLMSISGTIISTKDSSGRRSMTHKKSLISKEMIEEFIGNGQADGGEISLYTCNESVKCLEPYIKSERLKFGDTLTHKVEQLVTSIAKKIQADNGVFTEEEETLIALSSLSLITKIEIDLASYANIENSVIAQKEFIEALCFDVVTSYLTKLLHDTQSAVSDLSYAQIADSGVFEKFDTEVRDVIASLSEVKSNAFKRYDIISQTKSRLYQDIGYFNMKFEEFCSSQNANN